MYIHVVDDLYKIIYSIKKLKKLKLDLAYTIHTLLFIGNKFTEQHDYNASLLIRRL